jgi:hypothetical protein
MPQLPGLDHKRFLRMAFAVAQSLGMVIMPFTPSISSCRYGSVCL